MKGSWLLKLWAIGWGTFAALNYAPNSVAAAYNWLSWITIWAVEWTKVLIDSALSTNLWAVAWSLAPFAMPVVWGLIWLKLRLWDALDIQNEALRKVTNLTWGIWWAIIWAGLSSTYLPYAIMWWLWYLWYKWLKSLWRRHKSA